MARILKGLLYLLIVAFIGLVGYAYLGDLEPEKADVREPVQLDVD